ncbi:MAG: hypothetical protein Q7T44_09065 [Parvibaculum sp.]|nr:hypothetical protein [Parvibaculum sp.]
MTKLTATTRLLIIGIFVLLGACKSAPAPTQTATPEYAKSVSEQTVPAGKVRAFFKLGKFDGTWRTGNAELTGVASLYANGKRIGGVNTGEYMVTDIDPGHYTFTWRGGWDVEDALESAPQSVDLKAGQIVYLVGSLYQGVRLEPVVGVTNQFSSSLQVCFSDYCLNDFRKAKLVVSGR